MNRAVCFKYWEPQIWKKFSESEYETKNKQKKKNQLIMAYKLS